MRVRKEYTNPESGCHMRRLKDRRGTLDKRTLGMVLTPPSCKKVLLQKPCFFMFLEHLRMMINTLELNKNFLLFFTLISVKVFRVRPKLDKIYNK